MVKDSLPSSSSNTNADEDKLSWRNVDVINMIQLVVSDDISAKFAKTKKSHITIWNSVADQLTGRLGRTLTGAQVKHKFINHLKAEYMKRLKSIERSGADPTTLHDWIFYPHLDHM